MKSILREYSTGFLGAVLLLLARVLSGADCNENGLDDLEETRPTQPALAAGDVVPLGSAPASVQAADIDGDGDGDLLATHAAGDLSILYNDPGGFRVETIPTGAASPSAVAVDLDGDGDLELAVTRKSTSDVLLLENLGPAGFRAGPSYAVPAGDPDRVIAGDFDADGRMDLAVTTTSNYYPLPPGEVSVLLFFGSGEVVLEDPVVVLLSQSPGPFSALDLDRDEDLDLVVSRGEDLWTVLNDGGRAFHEGPLLAGAGMEELTAADLNLDGRADLTGTGVRAVRILLQLGGGAFEPIVEHGTGEFAIGAAVGDVDGDADPDLFSAHGAEVLVFLNDGAGVFQFHRRELLLGYAVAPAVAADLDRDGLLDLVLPVSEGLTLSHSGLIPLSLDCDGDAVPDECEVASGDVEASAPCRDCNRNGAADDFELSFGSALDVNEDGVPDSCQVIDPYTLGFRVPSVMRARIGSIARITATVVLYQGAAAGGVEGWAFNVGADAAVITEVTTRGTVAAPWPEGFFRGGFSRTGLFQDPVLACMAQARSAIVLSHEGPVELDPAAGPYDLLNLTVDVPVMSPEPTICRLWFLRGCGTNPPIDPEGGSNGGGATGLGLTITSNGSSFLPTVQEKTILIVPRTVLFRRGDANLDGRVDISDPIRILNHLFLGMGTLTCATSGDATDDGSVDVSDAIRILNDFFIHGSTIPYPGPYECGEDPTPDALPCEEHEPCA